MSDLKAKQEKTLDKNQDTSSMSKLIGYFTNKVIKSRIKNSKKNGINKDGGDSKLQKSSILSMN